jgi:excisionase family DNA binding protein
MHQRPDLTGRYTITIPEAAIVLGVSRNSAYQAARCGELPTIQVGRRKLVPTDKLRLMLGAKPTKRPIRPPGGAA